MTQFRPLLAYDALKGPIQFPLLASPKIDGIRCLIRAEGAVTRTLKPIPNQYVRETLNFLPSGLDGELVVGTSFKETTSAIMSQEGEPLFTFWVFDDFTNPTKSFNRRLEDAQQKTRMRIGSFWDERVKFLPHVEIPDLNYLNLYEKSCVEKGFEGVMIRSPHGIYKFGRSTINERILGKIKRFEDREAQVIGAQPLLRNQNAPEIGALGLQKRSHSLGNKVPDDCLGTLVVRDSLFADEFEIGTGFTEAERRRLWKEPPIGAWVRYKYLPHGTLERPRHPVFLGFRDKRDFSQTEDKDDEE